MRSSSLTLSPVTPPEEKTKLWTSLKITNPAVMHPAHTNTGVTLLANVGSRSPSGGEGGGGGGDTEAIYVLFVSPNSNASCVFYVFWDFCVEFCDAKPRNLQRKKKTMSMQNANVARTDATMTEAIADYMQLLEEVRDRDGWTDETYLRFCNAGQRLHGAKSVIFLSSQTLDQEVGPTLTDGLLSDMTDSESVPRRPFAISIKNEQDIASFGRSLLHSWRKDFKRLVAQECKKNTRRRPRKFASENSSGGNE